MPSEYAGDGSIHFIHWANKYIKIKSSSPLSQSASPQITNCLELGIAMGLYKWIVNAA